MEDPYWKRQKDDPKPVDEHTLDLLLASITNVRDRMLFMLVLATGLRISEMQQLDRDSITIVLESDPKGKEHVTGCGEVMVKGNKRRKFYGEGTTLLVCAEYLNTRTDDNPALFLSEREQRMSVSAIQHTIGAWCKKGGFPDISVQR
jgi:site-specific recombinase XerC